MKLVRNLKDFPYEGVVISGGSDGNLNFWKFSQIERSKCALKTHSVPRLAVIGDIHGMGRNRVVVGCKDGTLSIFSCENEKMFMKRRWKAHREAWIAGLDFCPQKKLIASVSHDNSIKLWKTFESSRKEENDGPGPKREMKEDLVYHSFSDAHRAVFGHSSRNSDVDSSYYISQVKFLKSNLVASSNDRGGIVFHDLEKLKLEKTLPSHHQYAIYGIDFQKAARCKGKRGIFTSVAFDTYLQLLDVRTYKMIKKIRHSTSLFSVHMPDSNSIVTGASAFGSSLFVYDLRTFKLRKTIAAHDRTIRRIISLSSQERKKKWICTCSEDYTIKIWDAKTFELKCQMDENSQVFGLGSFLTTKKLTRQEKQNLEDLKNRVEFLKMRENQVRLKMNKTGISVTQLLFAMNHL